MAIPFEDFEPAGPLPPIFDSAFAAKLEDAARAPFRPSVPGDQPDNGLALPALPPATAFVAPRAGQSLIDLGLDLIDASAIRGRAGGLATNSPRTSLPPRGAKAIEVPGRRASAKANTVLPAETGNRKHRRPTADSATSVPTSPVSHRTVKSHTVPGAPAGGRTKLHGNPLTHPAARTGLALLGLDHLVRQTAALTSSRFANDPEGFIRAWRDVQDKAVVAAPPGAKAAAKKTCQDCGDKHSNEIEKNRDALIDKLLDDSIDFYSGLSTTHKEAGNKAASDRAKATTTKLKSAKQQFSRHRTATGTEVAKDSRAADKARDGAPHKSTNHQSQDQMRRHTELVASKRNDDSQTSQFVKGAILRRDQIPKGARHGQNGRIIFLLPAIAKKRERRFVHARLLKDGRVKILAVVEPSVRPRTDELIVRRFFSSIGVPDAFVSTALAHSFANVLAAARDPFRKEPRSIREQTEDDGPVWTTIMNGLRGLQASEDAISSAAGEVFSNLGGHKFFGKSKSSFVRDFKNGLAITGTRASPRLVSPITPVVRPADELAEKWLKRIRRIYPKFKYPERSLGYHDFDVEFMKDYYRRLKQGRFRRHYGPGIIKPGRPSRITNPDVWLQFAHSEGARLPKRIQKVLAGVEVNNVTQLKRKIWKAFANDPVYQKQFSKTELAAMKEGYAPTAHAGATHGSQDSLIIHHILPKQAGGEPFDLSNIAIVTPRFHQEILPGSIHFGKQMRLEK